MFGKKVTITVCTTKERYADVRDVIDNKVRTVGTRRTYVSEHNDFMSFSTRMSVPLVAGIITTHTTCETSVVGNTIIVREKNEEA